MIGIWPTILLGVSQERLLFRVVIFKGFILADKSIIGIKRLSGLSELLREKADIGEKRFVSTYPLSGSGATLTVTGVNCLLVCCVCSSSFWGCVLWVGVLEISAEGVLVVFVVAA